VLRAALEGDKLTRATVAGAWMLGEVVGALVAPETVGTFVMGAITFAVYMGLFTIVKPAWFTKLLLGFTKAPKECIHITGAVVDETNRHVENAL
jgi:hypothetical protein